MKYEILGEVFVESIYGHYLVPYDEPNGSSYASIFFGDVMGFNDADIKERNTFITRELGISCYNLSPQFRTHEDLETFIDWFKNKYDRQRIILKKEQIKNFLTNPTVGY